LNGAPKEEMAEAETPNADRAGAEVESREDRLLGGRVRLRQPTAGYRVAIDPLLLAAAVPALPGERLLELGCGSGAASLCLLARVPACTVVGLELQPEMARLAAENAALNGCADRFRVVPGDLLAPPPDLGEGFDQVFMNPPYQAAGATRPARHAGRGVAHHEGEARLTDWVAAALSRLHDKGRLTLIHRADRLQDILCALEGRAGGVAILPLWPYAGRAAKRVIVQVRKASRAPMTLLPGLALHESGRRYSLAAEAILNDGAALPLIAGQEPGRAG
jgi:tRNA1(Val) A37 N6-methylase TrmN6